MSREYRRAMGINHADDDAERDAESERGSTTKYIPWPEACSKRYSLAPSRWRLDQHETGSIHVTREFFDGERWVDSLGIDFTVPVELIGALSDALRVVSRSEAVSPQHEAEPKPSVTDVEYDVLLEQHRTAYLENIELRGEVDRLKKYIHACRDACRCDAFAVQRAEPATEATAMCFGANIERCVQLHEEVRLYYVVDGYVAALMTRDGERAVLEVHAASAEQALRDLDRHLVSETIESVRRMPEVRFDESKEET